MKKHLNVRTMGLVSCVLALLCLWGCRKEKLGPCGDLQGDDEFFPTIGLSFQIRSKEGYISDYGMYLYEKGLINSTGSVYDAVEINYLVHDTVRTLVNPHIYLYQSDLYPRNINYANEKWYQYDKEVVDTFLVKYKFHCTGMVDSLFLKYMPIKDMCMLSQLTFRQISLTHRSNGKDSIYFPYYPTGPSMGASLLLPCQP